MDYVHISDTQQQVKDVLVHGKWHWNMLSTPLPNDIKHQLCALVLDDTTPDTLI